MSALFIVSAEKAAGKTTIGAGIGKYLVGDGKKVGYLRVIAADRISDSDAAFMKKVFSLSEPAESLCSPAGNIKEAYERVSPGKDVVIIEGACGESPQDSASKSAYEIAQALKAKVTAVASYQGDASLKSADSYRGFGTDLLGVVLNKVPRSRLKKIAGELSTQAGKPGINILGVIPEDRLLMALTISEVASQVKGEILNSANKSDELVENIMIGAMSVDSGLEYFGRKINKAVIVRDNRPDMQLAALETQTRCLVVSGTAKPIHSVRYRAENKGVPIIMTPGNTDTIVQNIEEGLEKGRFNQERKISRLGEIITQNLDLKAIYSGLGLTPKR